MLGKYEELIEERGVIVLPDDQNTLDITFATLTYDAPDLMIYEYQLEGYDKEWKILRGINSIKFSNLPSGEYTFKVRKQMDENSMQSFRIRIRSSLSAWLWLGVVFRCGCGSWCHLCYLEKAFREKYCSDETTP